MHKIMKESLLKEERNISAFLLLVAYAYLCGLSVPMLQDGNVSLGAYVLAVFTHQHYILYGLLIYGIYWMIKDIKDASELEKIRYGTYNRYYFIRIVCTTVKISIYILVHLMVAIFVGLGKFRIGVDLKTSELSTYTGIFIDGSHIDILKTFGKSFSSVIAPILISAVVIIVGFVFLYVILLYSYELKGNGLPIVLIGILVLSAVMGFKVFKGNGDVVCFMLNNYLIFHHVLLCESWMKCIVVNIIIIIVTTCVLHNITVYRKGNKGYYSLEEYIEDWIGNFRIKKRIKLERCDEDY